MVLHISSVCADARWADLTWAWTRRVDADGGALALDARHKHELQNHDFRLRHL